MPIIIIIIHNTYKIYTYNKNNNYNNNSYYFRLITSN